MADTAPKEISGLSGGLFNMFGNFSGIVTPIAIGYIIATSGSFEGALNLCRHPCVCRRLQLLGDYR